MQSRGFGRPITTGHIELFVDGQPQTIARWPNADADDPFERIVGYPEGKDQADGHGSQYGLLEEGFFYDGDRPRRWADIDDARVHGHRLRLGQQLRAHRFDRLREAAHQNASALRPARLSPGHCIFSKYTESRRREHYVDRAAGVLSSGRLR